MTACTFCFKKYNPDALVFKVLKRSLIISSWNPYDNEQTSTQNCFVSQKVRASSLQICFSSRISGPNYFAETLVQRSIQAHVTNKTSRLSAQTTSSLTVLITKTEQGIRTKWRNKLIPRSHYLQGFRGDIVINTNYNTILTLFRRAWSTSNKVLPPSTKEYNSRFSKSQTI